MTVYTAQVNATANATANTEDSFIELSSTSSMCHIQKVRVRYGDGTATTEVDHQFRIRLVRKSAAGTGGVAGPALSTKVRTDIMCPASGATVNVKSGTTAFTVGTVVDQIDQIVMNTRGIYEFIARDEDEIITTDGTATTIFSVLIQSPVITPSRENYQVSVYWTEA